jgi:hypothetical protein
MIPDFRFDRRAVHSSRGRTKRNKDPASCLQKGTQMSIRKSTSGAEAARWLFAARGGLPIGHGKYTHFQNASPQCAPRLIYIFFSLKLLKIIDQVNKNLKSFKITISRARCIIFQLQIFGVDENQLGKNQP